MGSNSEKALTISLKEEENEKKSSEKRFEYTLSPVRENLASGDREDNEKQIIDTERQPSEEEKLSWGDQENNKKQNIDTEPQPSEEEKVASSDQEHNDKQDIDTQSQPSEDENKGNVSSNSNSISENDEDILLKWDEEEEDLDTNNPAIEDELLRETEDEIVPTPTAKESTIKSNFTTPNVMLEIPTHEVIEFSDEECDVASHIEMSPDAEHSIVEETGSHENVKNKSLLDNESENPSEHAYEHASDNKESILEKLFLKSIDQEDQKIEKELLESTPVNTDNQIKSDKEIKQLENSPNISNDDDNDKSKTDNEINELNTELAAFISDLKDQDEIDSDIDECILLEDDLVVPVITEEQELKNAIECLEKDSNVSFKAVILDNLINEVDLDQQMNDEQATEPEQSKMDIEAVGVTKEDDFNEMTEERIATIELETEYKILDRNSLDKTTENILSDKESMKSEMCEDTNLNIINEKEPQEALLSETEIINKISAELDEMETPDENVTKTNLSDFSMPSTSQESLREVLSSNDKPSNKLNHQSILEINENNKENVAVTQDAEDVTDSLGLLAESSRIMDDDEDQDEDDDGEDDEEFDQDEESNQMIVENSEDSNAHQSETDVPKETQSVQVADKTGVENQFDMNKDMNIDNENNEVKGDEEKSYAVLKTVDILENEGQKSLDIETVRLSDTSDNEEGERLQAKESKNEIEEESVEYKQSCVVNIVDLEESSSEDDLAEITKRGPEVEGEEADLTSVNLPADIEVMGTSSNVLHMDIVTREGEIVISGIPKPPPAKPARLNTSEISIKTAKPANNEIFSLDSDEEESPKPVSDEDIPDIDPEVVVDNGKPETVRCINKYCSNECSKYHVADNTTITFYHGDKKRYHHVCQSCEDVVNRRNEKLIAGIRNFDDLMTLDLGKACEELVEISDSDSEDEADVDQISNDIIGAEGAKMLEEQLVDMLNYTWDKFKMEDRLAVSVEKIKEEMADLHKKTQELDYLLEECQSTTDIIRNELYDSFQTEVQEMPPFVIIDTPNLQVMKLEQDIPLETRSKRSLSTGPEPEAKRPAIPLGYKPLADQTTDYSIMGAAKDADDDKDISVVKLSAEMAPADLPSPGELIKPKLRIGMSVFAMRNMFGSWSKAKIVDVMSVSNSLYTSCKVRFEMKTKNTYKILTARCIAYPEPANARMTIGMRVIALFQDSNPDKKKESFYSGVVAEVPNPVNNYRYLIFFDDGYAQYASHANTRPVCECSSLVWEEVHLFSREFVKQYLMAYPERPMVRLHAGQSLKTEWNGKWWTSRVVKVDASLVQVQFGNDEGRLEWIYRGSTRLAPLYLELQAAEKHRIRAMPRAQAHSRTNMPYVEYTRSDEQANKADAQTHGVEQDIRRQRSVAKKSTASVSQPPVQPPPQQPASVKLENFTSRVVYYTPKNAVKPYKMVAHTCGPRCRRSDVLSLHDLRTYNPLAKPLLSGWERQIVRWKGHKEVMYCAPCGRRVRNVAELHVYLRLIGSDMGVDLFDFNCNTHCLAEFVINKCLVSKKDLSHGKENVPVPCVNYYDESLPEFCSYNTERTPTTGVPLNVDPSFLCGCDCDDDCQDKSKCACWKLTLEGARTIGLDGEVGYEYKRLPEPLPSGIYECNSRCKCKSTCMNRVAQHPLQLKLQVFKTLNRGWGIRALNDVPKGAFLCIYAGNLLTDATANLDGLNEGDEYLAELDYIEVVEQMKEGYEEDIPESIRQLDKKETAQQSSEASESENDISSEEEKSNKTEDDDFVPGYLGAGPAEFSKRLRKRNRKQKVETKQKEKSSDHQSNTGDDCITISDDEEVREPSRFTAAAGMGANQFVSKYQSVRVLYGSDEACYIMDAKVQGNIGRYLNHSCSPNVFVQNVFVDTHDPRFPWVAFFALCHIKAGTELTWNYNYDIGSVPGKVLYCYCGAPNCRRRLL